MNDIEKSRLAVEIFDALLATTDISYETVRYSIIDKYGYDEFREIQKEAFRLLVKDRGE